jgi:hypothetical protein
LTRRFGYALLLAAIVAVGTLVRLYQLGTADVWMDEGMSVWLARMPWSGLPAALAHFDEHPPLYFWTLKAFLAGGDGEAWLRVPSLLASVAAIVVAAALGHTVAGRWGGALAAAFAAFSPAQVEYAQTARMYAQVSLFAMAGAYAALRTLTGGERRWAVGWGSVCALLAGTSHTALAFAGALPALGVAGAALSTTRRALRPALTALAVFSVLWLLVAPLLVIQLRSVAGRFWIPRPTPAYVRAVALEATIGVPPPERHVQLSDPIALASPFDLPLALIALPRAEPIRRASLALVRLQDGVAAGLAVVGVAGVVAVWRRSGSAVGLALAGSMMIPPAVLLIASLARPVLISRATAASASLALVMLAVGCTALPRAPRVVAVTVVLLWELLALGQHWWYGQREDWRGTVAQLEAEAQPGDLVLVDSRWAALPLDYYLERSSAPPLAVRGVPYDVAEYGKPEPIVTPEDFPRVHGLLTGRTRAWLILSHEFYTDPSNLARSWLEAELPCFEVRQRLGVSLALFRRC